MRRIRTWLAWKLLPADLAIVRRGPHIVDGQTFDWLLSDDDGGDDAGS